ncbi:helix-turn-helix domain-containing protein [Bacillus paranthracis]
MELTTKLGEHIRFLRKEKNLSQERLGELSGIHTNHIGAIERGEKKCNFRKLGESYQGIRYHFGRIIPISSTYG